MLCWHGEINAKFLQFIQNTSALFLIVSYIKVTYTVDFKVLQLLRLFLEKKSLDRAFFSGVARYFNLLPIFFIEKLV